MCLCARARTQICKIRLWRDDDQALFERLRLLTADLMLDLAARCNARYRQLRAQPFADALLALPGRNAPAAGAAARLAQGGWGAPAGAWRELYPEM